MALGDSTSNAALTGRDRPIRFVAPTDQPHTIRLEPPVVVEGPLILRLEACRDA